MQRNLICNPSDLVIERLGKEGMDSLLQSFFEHSSFDEIGWVDVADLEWLGQVASDEELPVYTIRNDLHEVIIWPAIKEGEYILGLQLREERPDLEGIMNWH